MLAAGRLAKEENRRRMKRQIKVQNSFDSLAKDGSVTGDALKQLSEDLVESGIVSKSVFRQMAKDGRITSRELNNILQGITGTFQYGEGRDAPYKKDKQFKRNSSRP